MAATRCLVDTTLYADTVEWCKDRLHGDTLACGTYQLEETSMQRLGGINLYTLNEDKKGLTEVGKIESGAGVLDMRWSSSVVGNTTQLLLLTANADQCVRVYSLDTTTSTTTAGDGQQAVKHVEAMKIPSAEEETTTRLCLSIDVQPHNIVISDSAGQITLIDSRTMSVVRQWKGHTYEAWVATFDTQNKETILSGGDDCKLCIWDTRESQPVYTKRFDMGVCCIQSHPKRQHLYATGSYDEFACLWDQRRPGKPLKELPLGGGVWRLKWHPYLPSVLASATMYNGFHVINIETETILDHYNGGRDEGVREGEEERAEMKGERTGYEERGQEKAAVLLGYGIDWFPCPETENGRLLASCSFYDHSLQLWACSSID